MLKIGTIQVKNVLMSVNSHKSMLFSNVTTEIWLFSGQPACVGEDLTCITCYWPIFGFPHLLDYADVTVPVILNASFPLDNIISNPILFSSLDKDLPYIWASPNSFLFRKYIHFDLACNVISRILFRIACPSFRLLFLIFCKCMIGSHPFIIWRKEDWEGWRQNS